jgi:predicted dinucleotide-binding enzyme
MRLAILGTGNVAQRLARRWSAMQALRTPDFNIRLIAGTAR